MFIIYSRFDSIIILDGLALFVGSGINFSALLSNQSLVPASSRVFVDTGKLVFAINFARVGVVSDAIAVNPSNPIVAADFAGVCVSSSEFFVDAGDFVVAVAFVRVDVNNGVVLEVMAVTCLVVGLISSLLLL